MVFKAKIKCPICEGTASLSRETFKLFDGVITLKNNPIYLCGKCGEEFAVGKMVDETLKRAERQFSFTRQIISTGGSLAITLPPDISEYYNLQKGEKVKVIPKSPNEFRVIVE